LRRIAVIRRPRDPGLRRTAGWSFRSRLSSESQFDEQRLDDRELTVEDENVVS
jgi:hypothetical protein